MFSFAELKEDKNIERDNIKIHETLLDYLPFIPPQIQPKYLHTNLKLLTETDIQQLEEKKLPAMDKSRGIFYGIKGPAAISAKDGTLFQLGKGGSAVVKLANQVKTGQWRALKSVNLNNLDKRGELEDLTTSYLSECHILHKLGKSDEDEGVVQDGIANFLTELAMGQELFDDMIQRNEVISDDIVQPYRWPELIWLDIAIKVAQVLKDLHAKKILHKDIKLENIIYDLARQIISFVDFGFAVECKDQDEEGRPFAQADHVSGTPSYIAPELHKNTLAIFNEATEVYALGILYRLILLNRNAQRGGIALLLGKKTIFEIADLGITKLVASMIDDRPLQRPTVNQVIEQLIKARAMLIKNYSEQEEKANNIYKKAREIEIERLDKIYEKALPDMTDIQQLRQFIEEEKSDDLIIARMEVMVKHGFSFSNQKDMHLFNLMNTIIRLNHLKVLSYLACKGVDLNVGEVFSLSVVAATGGASEAIKILAKHGIDVNKKSILVPAAMAQFGLDHAKDDEGKRKYIATLQALYDACFQKTLKEHQASQKSTLFATLTFKERLDQNLTIAKLEQFSSEIDRQYRNNK